MLDLTHYNTLRVPAWAKNFLKINTFSDLAEINYSEPFLFLGLGANILFTHDFPGTIVKINLHGRNIIKETSNFIEIEVASGENWHDLVMWTSTNGWSGLENLALIPGTVGAAVRGNIAAYGQNQGDLVTQVTYYDIRTQKSHTLATQDCVFVYRSSIFCGDDYKDCLITSATYRLTKKFDLNTSYLDIRKKDSLITELATFTKPPFTPTQVAQAVINIRTRKLPDWNKVGTAGSFFKNPFVTQDKLKELQSQVSDLQFYPTNKMLYPDTNDPILNKLELVKIPVARLVDELGWNGKIIGHVSTAPKQPLCIINLGGATGLEIFDYAELMRKDVKTHFDLDLDYEVKII
ncbi:MAG: UDP-N-acetylmuramate dehydrogenase [Patescibacteria group bacterium]